MIRKIKWFGITTVALLLLSACGKDEVKPVSINADTDKCATCNMAVANNQFATEIILENGKTMIFDDIGCLYDWQKENDEQVIEKTFVRDYESKDWIELEDATYVFDPSIKTPMAYNVISFETKASAEDFIKENSGNLLSYDDLNKHEWERNKEMMMNKMKDKEKHK